VVVREMNKSKAGREARRVRPSSMLLEGGWEGGREGEETVLRLSAVPFRRREGGIEGGGEGGTYLRNSDPV